jgi:hypothetical protein
MTPRILAFAFVAVASSVTSGGTAFADEPVHARATVEVLDDKAQIDDVISRMRDEQQKRADSAQQAADKKAQAKTLRDERPPPPSTMSDSHRALAPEGKNQPPGSRRPLRDNLNSERAERPRPKHK